MQFDRQNCKKALTQQPAKYDGICVLRREFSVVRAKQGNVECICQSVTLGDAHMKIFVL
jgi:hypothetical protein